MNLSFPERTILPDPAKSRAVLIGAGNFTHDRLGNLPAVSANLRELHHLLTASDVWGLREEHCANIELLSGRSSEPLPLLKRIDAMASEVSDTFVLYYAGHGETCQTSDRLYLALPDSDPDISYTMIEYSQIREILRSKLKIRRKIVILDCCFSARGMDGGMGQLGLHGLVAPRGAYETTGMCVLTAAPEDRQAFAPPGAEYTAFSGELIAALRDGLPGAPALLSIDVLYGHLLKELPSRGFPEPQCSSRNLSRAVALGMNRAYDSYQWITPGRSGSETGAPESSYSRTAPPQAQHLLADLARQLRLLEESPNWFVFRLFLMRIIQAFDPSPFLARLPSDMEAGEPRADAALFLETVLSRLARLSVFTENASWERLASQIYQYEVERAIERRVRFLRQSPPEGDEISHVIFSVAESAADELSRNARIVGFAESALQCCRRSILWMREDFTVQKEPLVEFTDEVIDILEYDEPRNSCNGNILLSLAAICLAIAILFAVLHNGWGFLPLFAAVTFSKVASWNRMEYVEGMPQRMRTYYENNRPW